MRIENLCFKVIGNIIFSKLVMWISGKYLIATSAHKVKHTISLSIHYKIPQWIVVVPN